MSFLMLYARHSIDLSTLKSVGCGLCHNDSFSMMKRKLYLGIMRKLCESSAEVDTGL